jgi:hypothetical protein
MPSIIAKDKIGAKWNRSLGTSKKDQSVKTPKLAMKKTEPYQCTKKPRKRKLGGFGLQILTASKWFEVVKKSGAGVEYKNFICGKIEILRKQIKCLNKEK